MDKKKFEKGKFFFQINFPIIWLSLIFSIFFSMKSNGKKIKIDEKLIIISCLLKKYLYVSLVVINKLKNMWEKCGKLINMKIYE